jgi:hypothetical protein
MLTHNPHPPCTPRSRGRRSPGLLLCVAAAISATVAARADLTGPQVLVVYDSRVPDSVTVAEYYAGSELVPGTAGGRLGKHAGLNVVDLARLPGAGGAALAPTISYPEYLSRVRDPLRAYLNSSGLTQRIRCLVLTKGLPHRIQDINHSNPNVGDQPQAAATLLTAGNATYAAVDSELTLLWQNLNAGEGNGGADSKADGAIVNPYFKASQTITGYSTANITTAKTFLTVPGNTGILWRNGATGASTLSPGDIYLVCRLDGHSVAEVRAEIDRAQNLAVDVDTGVIVLDESASDGVQNISDADNEFDNDGPVIFTNGGDDYEQSRDQITGDGRIAPANLKYDRWATSGGFLVGPLIDFGGGTVVHGPVLLLATYGANHSGVPGTPGNAGTQYPFSFNYATGAAFNTIESYNGRSFGGIGVGPTPQGQLADFIQAGGTFGIGNVWEPFSFSVGDNAPLMRNFYLGSMTWAEAAYGALPVLSWQQIVVGDPLAKVRRTKEDVNADGVTGLEDMYAWFTVAGGARDLNRDAQINRTDVELLRNSVRGMESGNMRPGTR